MDARDIGLAGRTPERFADLRPRFVAFFVAFAFFVALDLTLLMEWSLPLPSQIEQADPLRYARLVSNQDLSAQGLAVLAQSGGTTEDATRALYGTFLALQGFDAHSTLEAMTVGHQEANPVLAAAMRRTDHPAAALLGIKAAATVVTIASAERLRQRNPRVAFWLMAAANSVYAGVVLRNYSLRAR